MVEWSGMNPAAIFSFDHGLANQQFSKALAAQRPASSESKPVALTVKVDHDTYVRLCSLKATQR
jgi:hypothetical protein